MAWVDYNSYTTSATSATTDIYVINQVHELSGTNEAATMDHLASEWYAKHGSDMHFLPREVNKEETTFGEYLSATFNKGYPIRMFHEEVEAWSGNGDMYSKFGLMVTDECTCWITKSFWTEQTSGVWPKQGDLIYIDKTQKLFEISHIEDEIQPAFYLLGNRSGMKISCKLFSYHHEEISQAASAGIPSAVQALDALLDDLDGNQVPLEQKDFNHNNAKIQSGSVTIINNDEDDPLAG